MFRKKTLELLITDVEDDWKICADKLIFSFAHLIGKSCLFDRHLSAYRRHSDNCFAKDYILGGTRYLAPDVAQTGLKKNDNLHRELFNRLVLNKDRIVEKIGITGYNSIVKDLMYSSKFKAVLANLKIIKKALALKGIVQPVILLLKYMARRAQYRLFGKYR
ncbi:MAG: hypothetical protein PHV82_19075 [Victivallaceae bacterium]|nr:hypothetical protein [Victivallaceae bacterium]